MSITELSLDHTAITVSDIEQAVSFYRDVLGCQVLGEIVQDGGNFTIVYLQAGEARIELFHFAEEGRGVDPSLTDKDLGFKHIAFRIKDIDAVAAALKSRGVVFKLEPFDATGGVRIAFFKDPDGNLIELISGKLELQPFGSYSRQTT
jgi:methylmalonyl-CoA epimerase